MVRQDLLLWLQHARESGLSDMKIQEYFKNKGLNDDAINEILVEHYTNPKNTTLTTPISNQNQKIVIPELSTEKISLFKKLLQTWLVIFLLVRIIYGLYFSLNIREVSLSAAWGVAVIFIIPGILIFYGLQKDKKWAYWMYILTILFSFMGFTTNNDGVTLFLGGFAALGSLIMFYPFLKLYNNLYLSE